MLSKIHTIAAWTGLVLGLVHTGLALTAPFSQQVLWFAGSGLAIIFAALSNLFRSPNGSAWARASLAFQNLVLTLFFAAAWLVLPQPQVVIGGIVFAGMLLLELAGLLRFSRKA